MLTFLEGVAASLVAWLVGLAIVHWIIPTAQGFLWRLTDISGSWLAYDQDPSTYDPIGDAEIAQRGPFIKMVLERHRDSEGKPSDTKYRYRGIFRARQLTLLWEALDRPDFRVGAMVLHLAEDAQEFRGVTAFYDDKRFKQPGVGAISYWLRRR